MTKAADALGIGQPHVSRAVAQLEAGLGFALFIRGHGSATPTVEGEAFAREGRADLCGARSSARRRTSDQGTRDGTAEGGVPAVAGIAPAAACDPPPRHGIPGARVALHVPAPDTIWSWVASGQCDLGIGRPRSGYVGVDSEPFLSVDAVCALPIGHALAQAPFVTVQDLMAETLIAGAPGIFQQSVEAAFGEAATEPRFLHMAQYTAARCGLVAEGAGLAIVDPIPARELAHLPIVLRPFRPRLPIESVMIRPAGRPVGQLAGRLISILKAERDTILAEHGR